MTNPKYPNMTHQMVIIDFIPACCAAISLGATREYVLELAKKEVPQKFMELVEKRIDEYLARPDKPVIPEEWKKY